MMEYSHYRAQFAYFPRHLGSGGTPRVWSYLVAVFIVFIGFFPALSFAEKPSTNSPALPVTSKTRQEVKKPLANFTVNPLIRLKNSKFQVLAGRKEPDSAIYINDQEVIPQNPYNSWYYEYPLSGNSANITVGMAFVPKKQVAKASPKEATPLNVEPPVITGFKLDPQTKDFILTIQDPPGVAAYNIYYADSLDKTATTNPFILAQSNYPVSGTGTTTWRDNGTYTGKPPLGPGIKMRFYKLEIAKINFQFTSITPADNSVFLAGARINIQPKAVHPNNDALQYQFSIGGEVEQPWLNFDTFVWYTSSSDTGTVSVTCEAKDTKGAQISKTITYRIVNPTLEEILQKVADNYAKIYDFKLDMMLSSTLNGQPFGATQYCRYYFKAPHQEKTESFSNQSRSTKTDTVIINGSTMQLIDPINNIKQEVDLLADAGIDATQFNQTDLYYNQSKFLTAHSVTINKTKTDFVNSIIALEANPKEKTNLYSKLELYIDYNKGLLVKIVHYQNDELPQVIEVIEAKLMPNGAWLASKLKKTPNLKAGNLIVILSYDNIQINAGLTDADFDPDKQF